MNPKWSPQEIWERAEMLVVSVDGTPTEGGIYNVAHALLDAYQRGSREALERAVEVVRNNLSRDSRGRENET